MRIALLAAALAGALSGFGLTRSEAPSHQSSTDASVIRAARLAQNAPIRAGEIDRAASYWTLDVLVLAGLGARVRGIDTLKAAFAADGRIVYERLPTGTWTGKDRTAADSTLITGRYSAQWVLSEAGWKIRSELFVADRCYREACRWPLALR